MRVVENALDNLDVAPVIIHMTRPLRSEDELVEGLKQKLMHKWEVPTLSASRKASKRFVKAARKACRSKAADPLAPIIRPICWLR